MKKILALLFAIPAIASASVVTTSNDADGWKLLVDGAPYIIKGVAYNSTATGQNPNVCARAALPSGATYYSAGYWDWMIQTEEHTVPSTWTVIGPYLSYNDQLRDNTLYAFETTDYGALQGDFAFMKAMNVNTIRIYTHASSAPVSMGLYAGQCEGELLFNHAPNTAILDDMFNTYGIRFAIGDEIGAYAGDGVTYPGPTDYTDAPTISSITASVRQMVLDFKDRPGLLMYILGNENEYPFVLTNASTFPNEYYTMVNDLAQMIHSMDPNHPVAIASGETTFIAEFAANCPDVDIFGVNSYRNPGGFTGFSGIWDQVSTALGNSKPMMLTEYGFYYPHINNPGGSSTDDSIVEGNFDALVRKNYWCDIQNHTFGQESPQNSIGGFNYEWLDEWWQAGNENAFTVTETGEANAGAQGLAAQGAGTNSPYARQFRPSYYMYQRVWGPNASCECGDTN